MMQLIVNGAPYTDYVAASATVALDTLANDFSFTASAVDGFPPFREGDDVQVLVDGQVKVSGHVEEISGQDRDGSSTITYSGRDKTGDLVDDDLDQMADLKPSDSLTLRKLVQLVLNHLGLQLEVVDLYGPPPFNTAEDVVAPQVGDGALQFILGYARKRQALLTSDGEGRIVITQSTPVDSGATVQSVKGGDNNVIAQSWTRKASKRFNRYVRRGQLDPRALNFAGDATSATVENQGGVYVDDEVRSGRQQVVVESESYSSEQLKDRAKWARQQAQAQAVRYGCTVMGHTNSAGDVWDVNTLVQVYSDKADISRKMLLNAVTFSQGEGQPTASALSFVEKNVYTINEKVLSQRPAGAQNDVFKTLG